uniref:Uncharacterized protein n=1 Tax=viral metagenome TaxID=1070528 RepID=A0A6C0IDZ3_9ZZZZ
MSTRPSFSLTPMYGLGSYGRVIGSVAISQPRNSKASTQRIYGFWKNQLGSYEALRYIQTYVFGNARIVNGNKLILV